MKLVICEAAKFCDKSPGVQFTVGTCEFKVPYNIEHTHITHCTHYKTRYRSIHDVDKKLVTGCMVLMEYIPDDTYLTGSLDELTDEREQNYEHSRT